MTALGCEDMTVMCMYASHTAARCHTPHATRHTPHGTHHTAARCRTPHATRHTPHGTHHTAARCRTPRNLQRHLRPSRPAPLPDAAGAASKRALKLLTLQVRQESPDLSRCGKRALKLLDLSENYTECPDSTRLVPRALKTKDLYREP